MLFRLELSCNTDRMLEKLLAVLVALPAPFYPPGRGPETPDEYERRLRTMAKAIVVESYTDHWTGRPREDLVALVAVTWYQESHFHLAVHKGEARGAGGRANCLGQIVPNSLVPRSKWRRLAGSDLESTRRCAAATIRIVAHHADKCVTHDGALTQMDAAKVFAGYAKGQSCVPGRRSLFRAKRWARVRAQISHSTATVNIPPTGEAMRSPPLGSIELSAEGG